MKQEKFAEALGHFELACRINPASSVLRCCCGLALHKMGGLDEAVRQLKVGGKGKGQQRALHTPVLLGLCSAWGPWPCVHVVRAPCSSLFAQPRIVQLGAGIARVNTCSSCCCSLLQAAIALDGRNPLARFELANVLMAQERPEEALQQLQELAVSSQLGLGPWNVQPASLAQG